MAELNHCRISGDGQAFNGYFRIFPAVGVHVMKADRVPSPHNTVLPSPGMLHHAPNKGVPTRLLLIAAGGILLVFVAAAAVFLFSGPLFSGTGQGASNASQRSAVVMPVNGQCTGNLTLCSGACVDLATDQDNCGACAFSVPFGQTCRDGQFFSGETPSLTGTLSTRPTAVTATSAAAEGSCNGGRTSCNGTCRDLRLDSANCGFCGNICASGYDCRNGSCSPKVTLTTITIQAAADQLCARGEILCGSTCADLFTDKKNCGVCGRACGDQEICVNARCGPACSDSGDTLCDNQCVDLDTDTENCGSCGTSCPTSPPNARGSLCAQGKCIVSSCKTDYADCNSNGADGCEINIRISASHCGSCGNRCPSGQVCYSGTCSNPIKT